MPQHRATSTKTVVYKVPVVMPIRMGSNPNCNQVPRPLSSTREEKERGPGNEVDPNARPLITAMLNT